MTLTTTAPMKLGFFPPTALAMIASAVYKGGESNPTVELAIYRSDLDPGQSDSRLTGESDFGRLKARQFFPGSGCGIIIAHRTIIGTEPGLRGFVGKYTSILGFPNRTDIILLVWDTDDIGVAIGWENELLTENLCREIIKKMDALSVAFT